MKLLTYSALVLGLVIIVVSGVYFTRGKTAQTTQDMATSTSQVPVPSSSPPSTKFQFTRLPFDDGTVAAITPVGSVSESDRSQLDMSHALPHVRHYLHSKTPGTMYNVYVPGDGTVTAMRYSSMSKQYRFNIDIDTDRFYYLDHIQSLDPAFAQKVKDHNNGAIPETSAVDSLKNSFKVTAGELIGQTGAIGIAWDWGLVDRTHTKDVINPERFAGATDTYPRSVYDLATDEIKTKLDALAGEYSDPSKGGMGFVPSVLEPKLGSWGQDVPGTLAGVWIAPGPMPTQVRPVVFKKDVTTPGAWAIRIGMPEFSIVGYFEKIKPDGSLNPDPAKVTKESGIVVYTLAQKYVRTGNEYGLLLARVNADNSITLETVKDKSVPPSPLAFSDKAITLTR